MAVNDLRINFGLLANRKFRRLKRLVGPGALEHLVCFWIQVALQAPSGDLRGWSGDDVEEAASWDGKRGALVAALEEVGFVDRAGDSLRVHDWNVHPHWIA